MKKCIYSIELPNAGICCNVYSNSTRTDGKFWAHWPKCSTENCPYEHPELLEGAIITRESEFIHCNNCSYWSDCKQKENRDGCYCGEIINENDL